MSYDSKVQYTATSSGTQPFGIPFQYIDQKDIIVKVDGVQVSFTWLNPASVSVAVNAGQIVEIVRDSSSDHLLVEFKDGSILKERDLNTGFTQAFYLGQEAKDRAESSIELDPTGNFDAKGHRITNVENPVGETDAVNKRYLAYEYPAVKLVGDNMGAVAIVAGDLSSNGLLQMDLGSVAEAPSLSQTGQTGAMRIVAENINQVRTVATNAAKVVTVSDNITDVGIVSDNITKVQTVSDNVAAIVTAATNIAAILDAPNQANAAANSATAAANSAAQAQSYAQQMASGIPDGSITSTKLATALDLGSV